MITLGVDTSSAVVAVCLRTDTRSWIRQGTARSANELVAALTDAVLVDAGIRLADINRIGFAIGPGSFTGLRIGLAFCKGLSFGLRIPLYTIGSFDAAAEVVLGAGESQCAVIAVTGKERYAAAIYGAGADRRWNGEVCGTRDFVVAELQKRGACKVVDLSAHAGQEDASNDALILDVGAKLAEAVASLTSLGPPRMFSLPELADIQPLYGREASFRTLASRGLAVGES